MRFHKISEHVSEIPIFQAAACRHAGAVLWMPRPVEKLKMGDMRMHFIHFFTSYRAHLALVICELKI